MPLELLLDDELELELLVPELEEALDELELELDDELELELLDEEAEELTVTRVPLEELLELEVAADEDAVLAEWPLDPVETVAELLLA